MQVAMSANHLYWLTKIFVLQLRDLPPPQTRNSLAASMAWIGHEYWFRGFLDSLD